MAEEAIYCPACNQKLRVPEEMLGQVVQCPLCNLVFAAPVRGGGHGAIPPAVRRVAESELPVPAGTAWAPPAANPLHSLRAPAIAILAVGVLGLLANGMRVLLLLSIGVDGFEEMMRGVEEVLGMRGKGGDVEFQYRMTVVLAAAFVFAHAGAILGAVSMLRGRSYSLALGGCFLSLLTVLDIPCCLMSLPFGIWGLVVLFRPEVRNEFQ